MFFLLDNPLVRENLFLKYKDNYINVMHRQPFVLCDENMKHENIRTSCF